MLGPILGTWHWPVVYGVAACLAYLFMRHLLRKAKAAYEKRIALGRLGNETRDPE